jgi:hypothetical protein
MEHLDPLSDEHPPGIDVREDPYEELAEADAAALIANGGLTRATQGSSGAHLFLISGEPWPDDGPIIINLT